MIILLLVTAVIVSSGCSSLLEGYVLTEAPYSGTPYEKPPEERIEVSNYGELLAVILDLVTEHVDTGNMQASNYDGDIQTDVDRACGEILHNNPIGAYAVANLTGETKRIVSIYEINISIEYKRTKQQIDSIVNVSTQRYLRTELLSVMSNYYEEAVFRTALNITEEDIQGYVREAYYQNPRRIVMLPVVAVEFYPENGEDRIFELRFGNMVQPGILRQYGVNLSQQYVRRNANNAVGETDAEILLSLANNLIASTSFDEKTARAISVHGAQNFAATAYGALANGNAVGEGFAMAYKALCDELGLDCRVVLGYRNGMVHAWNIVFLFGDYYHIDVAMCAANGIETAFLKTDEDFAADYSWDTEATVKCRGTLTYADIVGSEETAEPGAEPGTTDEPGAEPGTTAKPETSGENPGTGQSGEPDGGKPDVAPEITPGDTPEEPPAETAPGDTGKPDAEDLTGPISNGDETDAQTP